MIEILEQVLLIKLKPSLNGRCAASLASPLFHVCDFKERQRMREKQIAISDPHSEYL